jgi:hypothetical protein
MPVSLAGGWRRGWGLGRPTGGWPGRTGRGGLGRTEWRRQHKRQRRQNKGRRFGGRRRYGRCGRYGRCRRRSSRCRFRHGDGGRWLLQPATRHPGVVRVGHEAGRHHLGRRHIGGRSRGSDRVLVVVVHPPHRHKHDDQHHGGRANTPTEQLARPSAADHPATAAEFPQSVQGENSHLAEPCVSPSAQTVVAG